MNALESGIKEGRNLKVNIGLVKGKYEAGDWSPLIQTNIVKTTAKHFLQI